MIEYEQLENRIKDSIFPLIKNSNFVIVDVSLRRAQGVFNLRILIDRPEGGITLSDCSFLNAEIGKILDEKNLFEERYVLEVSSPGADRLLKEPDDFLRVKGRRIKISLTRPLKNKDILEGEVLEINKGSLILKTEYGNLSVPFSQIAKGNQILEFT